jgi:hypothetical protein
MAANSARAERSRSLSDDWGVAQRLMRTFEVVVRDVLGDQQSQMTLAERHHVIQALRPRSGATAPNILESP